MTSTSPCWEVANSLNYIVQYIIVSVIFVCYTPCLKTGDSIHVQFGNICLYVSNNATSCIEDMH